MQRGTEKRLRELERRAQAGGPLLVAHVDDNPPRYRIDGRAVSMEAFELALPSARAVVCVRRVARLLPQVTDETL